MKRGLETESIMIFIVSKGNNVSRIVPMDVHFSSFNQPDDQNEDLKLTTADYEDISSSRI